MEKKIRNLLVYKILQDLKDLLKGIIDLLYFFTRKVFISTIKDHFQDKKLGIETGEFFYFRR